MYLTMLTMPQRDNLDNPDNISWFNIFNVIFELVSAYGTVGLSLGTATVMISCLV
jgi:Trk-type K+ transport system membrane component